MIEIVELRTRAAQAGASIIRRIPSYRSRRMRRIGIAAASVVAFFALAGFAGVPLIAQYVVAGRLGVSLHRSVSMTRVRFNPFSLRLNIDRLHIGERGAAEPFVDIGHLRVKLSWTSLFRLAPVVGEVALDRPAIHIVRTAEQRFNFSDLLEGPPRAPKPNAKPQRFAVSNIQIHDGEVRFDDRVLGAQHALTHLELDVPFIANLPADVDIFVQPLLQMVVDGSPLRIAGRAKPFAVPPESVIDLNLHKLSLPLYLGYAPRKLPVRIPQGTLSSRMRLHFVNAPGAPVIRIGGNLALDHLEVRDAADAPLVGFNHLAIALTQLEPLESVTHLKKIYLDGLTVHVVRNADGSLNFASLAGKPASTAPQTAPAAAAAQPAQVAATQTTLPTPAAATTPAPITGPITASAPPSPPSAPAPAAKPVSPFDLSIDALDLTHGAILISDNSTAPPAALEISALHVGLKDLRTVGQKAPATYDLSATLGGGGSIAVKGTIDLAQSQAATDISLGAIDLPALQAFAAPFLAATVASGKLNAQASLKTSFGGGQFNLHVEPAAISLDQFELRAPNENESPLGENPLGWNKLSVSVGQADLAARQATVTEVRSDGLHLFVRRAHDGRLSLMSLVRAPTAPAAANAPSAPATPSSQRRAKPPVHELRAKSPPLEGAVVAGAASAPAPAPQPWHYQVASVAVEKTEIKLEDDTTSRRVAMAVAPLNLHIKNVSDDLSKPFALDLDGIVNGKGSFKVTGMAAPAPLKADLRIATRRLDLSAADPFVTQHLNTTIASAALTMNGALGVASERKAMRVSYRGDATLGSVRMLDKVTKDSFLRWNSLSANGIDFNLGSGSPKIHVAALALENFYARVILNSDGRLNLRDVTANPEQAPTSLTRAHPAEGTEANAASPAPAPPPEAAGNESAATAPEQPAAAPTPVPADIELGQITFEGGQVNYSDNFIRPNYSADLTEITGKVGSFGTASTAPAAVELAGQVNGNAPLEITGSLNPLAPMAFVDISAKADDVELTGASTYSAKYTGYPITDGTLTVDVHYLLDRQKLTAENHILIKRLTFGDKVESPNALNLPIRLAVSLLKDSRGQINLDLPISGSLSDPKFSIGAVILHVLGNLIAKAVTSPFSLIASIGGGKGEDLNYIEFAPGWAVVTPGARSKLDTIAKALQERPALRLNITGRVDPNFDREGLREALVAQSIARQKIKDSNQDASKVDLSSVQITPDEYNKYLRRAYKAADFPKPTDFLGMNKSLPPDEMKKLMLTNTKVTDADLKQLAEARADAVRRALGAKIDSARLAVTAPKLNADGIQAGGKTTRVEFSLE